jgi:BirA family transcriptional regulator, biotin operon repressor / biotin---[acetyl-CoA-carboxylase] ligase
VYREVTSCAPSTRAPALIARTVSLGTEGRIPGRRRVAAALSSLAAFTERWADANSRRRIGRAIEYVPVIGSTNDRARELLVQGDADGAVVVADEQTAGRGRRGRTWQSPPGRNLYLSVALVPEIGAADAWRLGLATALAVAGACEAVARVALKWPNDVVSAGDGRKVGGLLVETIVESDRLRGAVLGIGINVNWRRSEMPPDLRERATSLADVRGASVDREELLGRLLDALETEVAAVEAELSPLERYRARCSTLGATVEVETADGVVSGRAVDLDATGALVVEDRAGVRSLVSGGEVTRVRPAVPA